jgi:hydroxymethylglutaryl-CoA reductase (NADPH)
MSATHDRARKHLLAIAEGLSTEEIARRLSPKHHATPGRVPGATQTEASVVDKRWALLTHANGAKAEIADAVSQAQHEKFTHNIENFIGTVKLPVGLAGPLRVNGIAAQGDYYIPLATTEAALVASYHRGACVVSLAGGCTTLILNEGVGRAPAYAFGSLLEVGNFVQWCLAHVEDLRAVADATSRFGRLKDIRFTIEGNHVYLLVEFTTGDASGQNMVTIATQAICDHIEAVCPIKPTYFFVESNMSGDKKASAQSFQSVRGRKPFAQHTGKDGGLLAHVRARRCSERDDRRARSLCQWTHRLVHRVRSGCSVCVRGSSWRNAI